MKMGVGLSQKKEVRDAIREAHRQALQRLGVLKADWLFVFYTYDHWMDQDVFRSVLNRELRDIPHLGCSSWAGWTDKENFEAESGIMILAMKDFQEAPQTMRIHSLKEKAELWSTELSRQIDDFYTEGESEPSSLFIMADSIHFRADQGFQKLKEKYPNLYVFGFGASFGVPQCGITVNGDVYGNALVGFLMKGVHPWLGLLQHVHPESPSIAINRMSENLIIEIDEKPAFYRLCEHLMQNDDLPMMPPEEFRKHMGNLYIVERKPEYKARARTLGEPYRVVSLLGSEMMTGMVAVGEELDFQQQHFLGQKKRNYAEVVATQQLEKLHTEIPEPQMIWMFSSMARYRDVDRSQPDIELVRKLYPNTPILGLAAQGEYFEEANQGSCLIVAFP